MNISYQPLWNTLKERGMRKEDLRLAAGLTTNMIANMGKGEHISMKTLLRICEALNCFHRQVFCTHYSRNLAFPQYFLTTPSFPSGLCFSFLRFYYIRASISV